MTKKNVNQVLLKPFSEMRGNKKLKSWLVKYDSNENITYDK